MSLRTSSFVAGHRAWLAKRPKNLLWVEFDPEPRALDVGAPRFSWIVPGRGRNLTQTAYHLLVASSLDRLKPGKADLWDTGPVESGESIQTRYAGQPMESNRDYVWKVRTRNQARRWGKWSQIGRFSTALLSPADWTARWIGRGSASEVVSNVDAFVTGRLAPEVKAVEPDLRSPLFRKEFDLSKPVRRARVFVTGLGLYELRLNGQKGGDAVLSPPKTDFRKRILYDTHDVTAQLVPGRNAVGLVLGNGWFNGQKKYWGWQYQWYGSPRALLQLEIEHTDGSHFRIVTDSSWKASWGPVVFNCIYDGEDYDARLEQPGWDSPGFDDSAWAQANEVPSSGGVLASSMAQPNQIMQDVCPVAVREVSLGVFVYDLGQNFTGWVRLKVSGPAGTTVKMRFAEALHPDGTIHTGTMGGGRAANHYTLKGQGEEIYEPRFTYCGFQYVEVTGYPGTPGLDALAGRFVHTGVLPAGDFKCSSPAMNHIHRCMVQSQRSNLQMGVPTDDTQRPERIGWGADAWISAPQALANLDMPRLYAKWTWDFQDSQAPSGVVGMIVPRAGIEEDLVWSCAYLFIPWWQYARTGDRWILEDHYDSLVAYMDYLATQGRAELAPRPKGTNPLFEPPEAKPQPLGHLQRSQWGDHLSTAEGFAGRSGLPLSITTAFYCRNAQIMQKIATVLGKPEDARRYGELASAIREAFNRKFFDPATNRYDDGTQGPQAWALDFGLVPEGREKAVFAALLEDLSRHGGHPTTGYPGTPSLIAALMAHDRPDLVWAMANLTDCPSWISMMKGRTTVPEAWSGGGSWNHHALASPLDSWFYTILAGIQPDEAHPGYGHIVIRPWVPPDLKWVRASIDTLRGTVASSWRKTRAGLRLDVAIPANACATVYIPAAAAAEVQESGRPLAEAEGVGLVGVRDGALLVHVGSGRYLFTVGRSG
jgi:alpha-L-rhamnosidase